MIRLPVDMGDRSYEVLVGAGVRHRLCEVLPVGVSRAAVVTEEAIGIAVDTGVEQRTFHVDGGEESKNLETVEELCRGFARWGLHRNDVVVAVGGGIVTDTAGFAAAVYHRGVAVVHLATTLLAQVDAAIGGKTGVNLPEGKNLVGAFWQPAAVLCDTETLATLPPEEYRSGMGEVAKYHFLDDAGDLDDLPLDEKVARCVAIKAAVVSGDEREDPSGLRPHDGRGGARSRAVLNYGHTLAHALETGGGYSLRHGEAVAIGLVFAAELAHRLGRIDQDRVKEHRRLVEAYDLPSALPPAAAGDIDRLVQLMARDKKALGGLTFVLDGNAGVDVVTGVTTDQVRAALAAVGGRG